jgi:hypothetical protein
MSITLFALISVCALSANAQMNQTPVSPPAVQKIASPLTAAEKKPLLVKFKKTLSAQEKTLDRDENKSLSDFTIMQSQQFFSMST